MTTKLNVIPRQENNRMRGLILSGRAGIGKTSALMALVSDGEEFVRIPMASRSAEDFGVYPVPDKKFKHDAEGKRLKDDDGEDVSFWTMAQPLIESQIIPLLKDNIKGGYGVLLLDDVTLADPRLQSGLLELVQFGRIGDFELGENVLVAMTGNGVGDGCSAVEWNKALLGRSMFVEYEPDFDTWLKFPCNVDLDSSVIGFLKEHHGYFAPGADDDQYSDENGKTPSPRDWTSLGLEFAKCGGVKNYTARAFWPTPSSFVSSMCGKPAGDAFNIFSKLLMEYPSSEEILKDPAVWRALPLEKRNQMGCVFAIATSLRATVTRMNDKINKEHTNLQSPAARDAKEKLTKSMCYATAALMSGNREMGAFVMRDVMANQMEVNKGKGEKDPARDPFGSIIAKWAYNLKDLNDPVLQEAEFGKVIDDIRKMGGALGN
jgi:hypothetical protein